MQRHYLTSVLHVCVWVRGVCVCVGECEGGSPDLQAWLHKEDPFDDELCESFEERVHEEWVKRFAGREHDAMSVAPEYMMTDNSATAWSARPLTPEAAAEDGRKVKDLYYADAQYIFSRVQHHVHHQTSH